jgi:aldehyde dehydrogenase (NAD+)/betaine-aldehyde dehydrogenase
MRKLEVELYPALIGGERVFPGDTFEDIDPATGRLYATVARCGVREVDQAVASARETFERTWRHTTTVERARILRRVGDLIRRDRDKLAELESLDTGKPLRQARTDADVAARYFEFYGDVVEALYGDTIPALHDIFVYTLREPYGVTAHIIPWNYPMQIGARTVAPALAAGNCCVLKPAEEAPLTAIRLGELALEAGLPAGTLNVIPGFGEEAGAPLAAHPGIDHLAFIGSAEVGQLVSKAAADNIIPVTLELGGKSPNLVLADADLKTAIPVIVNSIIQNAGQTCSAGSRLLVEQSVHDQLVEGVAEAFKAIRIGPGIDDPDLGPLISQRQRDRVCKYVELGKQEARLVLGGGVPRQDSLANGFFFLPTLFDQVSSKAVIAQEEIFGPVLAVSSFGDLEEGAAVANGTRYGLIAAVWTRDIGKVHWLARELRVGQVYVNTYGAGGGVELPFGGFKRSGFGREKGFEALRSYTQVKTVAVKMPLSAS